MESNIEYLFIQYSFANDTVKTTKFLIENITRNTSELSMSSMYSTFYNDKEHQLTSYKKTLRKYESRIKVLQNQINQEIDFIKSVSIDIFKFTHYGLNIPSDVLYIIQNFIVCDILTF